MLRALDLVARADFLTSARSQPKAGFSLVGRTDPGLSFVSLIFVVPAVRASACMRAACSERRERASEPRIALKSVKDAFFVAAVNLTAGYAAGVGRQAA